MITTYLENYEIMSFCIEPFSLSEKRKRKANIITKRLINIYIYIYASTH